jgi:hypothetical protein
MFDNLIYYIDLSDPLYSMDNDNARWRVIVTVQSAQSKSTIF